MRFSRRIVLSALNQRNMDEKVLDVARCVVHITQGHTSLRLRFR